MKFKNICSICIAAAIVLLSFTIPAYASEQLIYKADLTEFNKNNGWMEIDSNNNLVLYPKIKTDVGKESYSSSSSFSYNRNLPRNTELTVNIDFTLPQAPHNAGEQIWFRLDSAQSAMPVFSILSVPGKNIQMGFCSTTSWPFTEKALDRDPDSIASAFEYGKSYSVQMTFKPHATNPNATKVVIRVFSEGNEIGAAIIDEYQNINYDFITSLQSFTIAEVVKVMASEVEPIVYVNDIGIIASYTDEPISYTTVPQDGETDIYTGSDAYIEFASAVNPVSLSQVEISGGNGNAEICGVSLSTNSKKLTIDLKGLEPNTEYTVKVHDVLAQGAEDSFDYSWSFVTGSAVMFDTPYMSSGSVFQQDFSEFNEPVSGDFSGYDYLSGNAWASNHSIYRSYSKDDDVLVDAFGFTSDGYLGIYRDYDSSLGRDSWHRLSHKIKPVEKGNTLKITGTIDITGLNSYNYSFITLNLGNGVAMDGKEDKSAKNISIFERAGSWTSNFGTLAKNRYNFNADRNATDNCASPTGQAISLSVGSGSYMGDTKFEFTLEPKPGNSDTYIAKTKIMDGIYSLEIPYDEVSLYDTLSFTTGRNGSVAKSTAASEHSKAFVKVGNIKVEQIPTTASLKPGTNTINIPYKNAAPSYPSKAYLIIAERLPQGDAYGEIVGVTVKELDELTQSEGICTCNFEITGYDTVADVFVLNSIGQMQLVAENISFSQAN